MGLFLMGERELNRIEVLSQVVQRRMTVTAAANVLGLSRRQVQRLLKRFRNDGPAAIRHKARGRSSNHQIEPAIRDFAITLVKEQYADFGPTLAAGIWRTRKQRRKFHQPRLRREGDATYSAYGELPYT